MKKTCSKCKVEKDREEFTNNKAQKDGKQYFCKPCGLEHRRLWMLKNKDKRRQYGLKAAYNLDMDTYNKMFEEQQRSCAICYTDEPGGKSNQWCLDHCHTTDKIRGILCSMCNLMLGHAKDKPTVLRNGADYLEFHHPEEPS